MTEPSGDQPLGDGRRIRCRECGVSHLAPDGVLRRRAPGLCRSGRSEALVLCGYGSMDLTTGDSAKEAGAEAGHVDRQCVAAAAIRRFEDVGGDHRHAQDLRRPLEQGRCLERFIEMWELSQ